jgi:hypothetical protein
MAFLLDRVAQFPGVKSDATLSVQVGLGHAEEVSNSRTIWSVGVSSTPASAATRSSRLRYSGTAGIAAELCVTAAALTDVHAPPPPDGRASR